MFILIIAYGWKTISRRIADWQSAHYEAEMAARKYGRDNVTLRRI